MPEIILRTIKLIYKIYYISLIKDQDIPGSFGLVRKILIYTRMEREAWEPW